MLIITVLSIIYLSQGLFCDSNYEYQDESLQEYEAFINIEDYEQLEGFSYSFWMKYIILLPSYGANEEDSPLYFQGMGFIIFSQNVNDSFYDSTAFILMVNDHSAEFYFNYLEGTKDVKSVTIPQDEQNLDGVWIFFMITFLPFDKQIIIQKNDEILTISVNTVITGSIITKFGYQFLVRIGERAGYFVDQFPGYLSQLQLEQYQVLPQNLIIPNYLTCQMVDDNLEEINHYFVKGMQRFNLGLIAFQKILISGERYRISGWVQLDYSRIVIIDQYQTLLMRVTINSYYQNDSYFGDRYFYYQYNISEPNLRDSLIDMESAHYNAPFHKYQHNQRHLDPYDYDIWQMADQDFYNQFQQWHYFIYEQARGESIEENSCVYIFFQGRETIKHCFGKEKYRHQFSNNYLYFYVGQDDYIGKQFIGSISDLKVTYNYIDLKPIEFACHYSCLTCDGPLENDCLSCSSEQKRVYVEINKQCICQIGYLNVELYSKCLTLNDLFYYVKQEEQIKEDVNCKYGQFKVYKTDSTFICLQCPQYQQSNNLNCLDCLIQTETWYLSPMCTMDFIANNINQNQGYNYYQRDEIEYEIYYINQFFELVYAPQFSYLCSTEDLKQGIRNCLKITIQSVQTFYAICSEPYYYENQDCYQCSLNCLKCSQFNFCNTCSNNYYLINGFCMKCPENCLSCQYFELEQKVGCTSCGEKFYLFQGLCQQCGSNCKNCIEDYDSLSQKYYLRCIQCLDPKIYYLSIKNSQCVANDLKFCLIAYEQVIIDNQLITTLDYQFQIQDQNIVSKRCARCLDNYAIDPQGDCVEIAQLNLEMNCEFASYINFKSDYQCINGNDSNEIIDCISHQKNCFKCIKNVEANTFYCIICEAGYYADRLTGMCVSCSLQLNCQSCYQQLKETKDSWIIDIINYFDIVINEKGDHSFLQFGQSQNIDDYEIICESCSSLYSLSNDTCIPRCFDDCKLCSIENNQQKCIQCDYDNKGRIVTIIDNVCVSCPINCQLCIPSSDERLTNVNQLFIDQNYAVYSRQCVKPSNSDASFDSTTGLFISCNTQQNCEKSFIIEMILFCNKDEYEQAQANNLNDKYFNQANIYIEDLLNTNFQAYYDDLFYLFGNEIQISSINFIINSNKAQVCSIPKNFTIKSEIQNHIFSLRTQNLEMNSQGILTLEISGILIFENFQNIKLQNIQIIFSQSELFNEQSLLFQSKLMQNIQLDNIFLTTLNQDVLCKIEFRNFKTISLSDIKIINTVQESNPQLFYFYQTENSGQIQIKNCFISSSSLINSTLFYFYTPITYLIQFQDISLQFTNFTNQSILIACEVSNYCGDLWIQNLEMNNLIINNSIMLKLDYFQNIEMDIFTIEKNLIIDSVLTQFGQQILVNQFSTILSFLRQSVLFVNTLSSSQKTVLFEFSEWKVESNEYDKASKILYLQKWNSHLSYSILEKITIMRNSLVSSIQEYQYRQYNFSLIYLELNYLNLSNLDIQDEFGLPILSLINFTSITINQAKIEQSGKVAKEIINNNGANNNFGLIFKFFSIQTLKMENLIINSTVIVNNPFLVYESQYLLLQQQSEILTFKDFQLINNIIFQKISIEELSLISISSEQKVIINFENISFIQNAFITQIAQNKLNSAALLYINCPSCNILILYGSFISNSAINSTLTINYIISQDITINQTNFSNNGIVQVEMPNIIQYTNIFSGISKLIYQISGIGFYKVNIVIILNSNISQSQGFLAGGLVFSPTSNSELIIENCFFNNISNYFQQTSEKGGIIYIEQSTNNLNIIIRNTKIENVCSLNGGILYIENSYQSLNIDFSNLTLNNVYSVQGSLLKVLFLIFYINSSKLQISNIMITNSLYSYQNLLKLINAFENVQAQVLQQQMQKSSIIQSQYGQISIFKLLILESHSQIILLDDSYKSVIGFEIYIANSTYQKYGFFQLTPLESHTFIQLKNVNISNNKVSYDNIPSEALMNLNRITSNNIIYLADLDFSHNNCSLCVYGNIFISGQNFEANQITILRTQSFNNQCGKNGCVNIVDSQYKDTEAQLERRLLTSEQQYQIFVQNYQCLANVANYGVCLNIVNFNAIIMNSLFYNNSALISGGAIAYFGQQKLITIKSSFISENEAKSGGGVYFQSSFPQNFSIYKTIFLNNKAIYFGSDFYGIPTHLNLQIYKESIFINNQRVSESNNTIIDYASYQISEIQFIKQTKFNYSYFMLPSGQHIHLYEYFNWNENLYQPLNILFKLIPMDQFEQKLKNLSQSKCSIDGRIIDINNLDNNQQFTKNFTNLNEIYYDLKTEDYNLDELIIYFDPDLLDNLILQLQFKCNSIKFPILSSNGEQIIGQSDEYYFRVNIRTFPCQLGEIKSEKDYSCHPCDFASDFYSVTLNAAQCKIRDNQIMDEVKSAQIKLRSGYWRPYINSEIVENCYNQESNCLGGWNPGDKGCAIGHIGALCEQCDIHNIRGDGSYSISKKFSCGSCNDNKQNTLVIIGISIWTLISILISVKSTVEIVKQLARATKLKSIGISIVVNKNNAVNLMKILTNYLQIIASVTSFQLSLPKNMDYFINSLGNPVETMAYSLDCFLKDMFKNIEIQYSRAIWQLIMPIFYILIFFQLYGLGIALQFIEFSFCAITTTLIYMFLYLQPNIVAGQIGILSYRTISDFQWILGNVSFRYDTYNHAKWLLSFCLPIILLFAIFIPLFFFIKLNKVKNSLNIINNRLVWGYLYNEYKQEAYFWEIVKIIEKELIIIALTFYSDSIVVKAALTYSVIFIYNFLTIMIHPYHSMKLNILDHQSTRICGLSIVLGVGIYGAINNNILEVQIPFLVVLALVNFLFLVKLIFEILQAYFLKFEVVLDKLRDYIRQTFPRLLDYPYLNRILKNQGEARKRAIKHFKKIKIALILISKEQLKQQQKIQNELKHKQSILLQESALFQTIPNSLNTVNFKTQREIESAKLIKN